MQKKLARSEKRNADALRQLDDMTRSRLFKLVHLFNRILHQSFHKDKAERRKFRKWIMGRFRHIPDMDHRYNPLFSVISLLTGQNDALDDQEISDLPAEPERQNEVSGLMIMGLFGGTVFPLLMGFASDFVGTVGAVLVMAVGAVYLSIFTMKISK